MLTLKKRQFKKRHVVQIIFFIIVAIIAVNHSLVESGQGISWLSSASLHAICPFGGVVTLYQLFTLGTFVQKIHSSAVILMGIILLMTLLFGPVFCGYICPLGSFQEAIGRLGKRLFKKRYNHFVPQKIDKVLRFLRYIILARVVYITAMSGYLVFADIDPYNALFSFWTSDVSKLSIVVLLAIVVLSLFVERPWCKYACPYGALLGLFNRVSFFKLKRRETSCIQCKKCDDGCPMNIDISSKTTVNDLWCIKCMACTSGANCPVSETVTIEPVIWKGAK